LHVDYAGSQLAAGVAYLKSHPNTRLVTLMIGFNDFLLCESITKDYCASRSERKAVLSHLASNLKTILEALRKSGYRDQIVLVGYYSLNYESAHDDSTSRALDAIMQQVGSAFNAEYANGYDAWAAASRFSGGDPCRGGLLTQLYRKGKPNGTCGIHPTRAGAAVLASAVDNAAIK
jgi:lysophospholipase L1-like esterase